MKRHGSRTMKQRRNLTVAEIKIAICDHAAIEPVQPPEHRAEWAGWHTQMRCPACRLSYVHVTLDTAVAAAALDRAAGVVAAA